MGECVVSVQLSTKVNSSEGYSGVGECVVSVQLSTKVNSSEGYSG